MIVVDWSVYLPFLQIHFWNIELLFHAFPLHFGKDSINSVKKSFKKHDYKPDAGDTVEDAAAKICTDARKEGGATLDYGEKRKKEIEKARPGGKSGK